MNGVIGMWLALLSLVPMIPEHTIIPLDQQQQTSNILVRNASEAEWRDLRISVRCALCKVQVTPDRIDLVAPSDWINLMLKLERTADTGEKRFPVEVSLMSRDEINLARFHLLADGRGNSGIMEGWMDVGSIQVGQSKSWAVALGYLVVCAIPLVLLLLLGWWLKRRARSGKA